MPKELQLTPLSSASSVEKIGAGDQSLGSSLGSSINSLNNARSGLDKSELRGLGAQFREAQDETEDFVPPLKPPRKSCVFTTPPSHVTSVASVGADLSENRHALALRERQLSKSSTALFQQVTPPSSSASFLSSTVYHNEHVSGL